MPFRPPPKNPKFADLKTSLAQSQKTDEPLYQTVQEIIERLDTLHSNIRTEVIDLIGKGNGGGGTGEDEVFVGPNDPGSPPYELWYDTDSPEVPISGHHANHEAGGFDAIKLDDLALPDNNTDLNATTTYHGLLPRLPNDPLLFLSGTGRWWYVTPPGGVLAAQPIGLTPGDAGLIWYVAAPYFHAVLWNGFNWEFAPGDGGNGFMQNFAIVPQTGGWIHCNGAATDYLVVGGVTLTTAAFTTPNLTTGSFMRNALWAGGAVNAGSASTGASGVIGGTANSAGTHTHTGGTTGIGTFETGGVSSVQDIGHAIETPGAPEVWRQHKHTHDHSHGLTIDVGAGAHTHSLSVDSHTHSLAGTVPPYVDVSVYFRR